MHHKSSFLISQLVIFGIAFTVIGSYFLFSSRAASTCNITLNPGADVASTLSSAASGSIICLNPGTYTATTVSSGHGTANQHVTLTSADYNNPAVLDGRFGLLGTASYIDVTHLKFTWNSATADTVTVAAPNTSFQYDDISGNGGTICLNPSPWNGYSPDHMLIDHNLIHDCGNPADSSDQIHAQGIYIGGGSNITVSNNWCWSVAARCFQERGGQNDTWKYNVADDANYGALFGDLSPTNDTMYGNIIGLDVKRYNNTPGTYAYGGALAIDATVAGQTGNTFHDNCYPAGEQIYGTPEGGTFNGTHVYNDTLATPQFVNAASHNYSLTASSPCQGFGVQNGTPGPSGSSTSGDINGDGHVNITDLSLLLSSYGSGSPTCTTNPADTCDLSGDGAVGIVDLSILLSHYGT